MQTETNNSYVGHKLNPGQKPKLELRKQNNM